MKLRLECLRQLFRRGGAAEPNDATRRVELVCPCLVCNNLRGHALDGINPQHRQIVLYDISRAASKGCCTCALLENGIVQTFPAVRSIPKRVSIHACHYDVERCVRSLLPLRLFIRAMHKSRAIERKIVEFFILPESTYPEYGWFVHKSPRSHKRTSTAMTGRLIKNRSRLVPVGDFAVPMAIDWCGFLDIGMHGIGEMHRTSQSLASRL